VGKTPGSCAQPHVRPQHLVALRLSKNTTQRYNFRSWPRGPW